MTPHDAVARARIRALIGSTGDVLSTTWPLRTFVAVNPLRGLEHLAFEEAVDRMGELLGIGGKLSLDSYRVLHRDGRITDADLDAALRRRLPQLMEHPPVPRGHRDLAATEILRCDLLHGTEAARARRPRGAAEWCDALLGTALAAAVDEQVAKWCAAFCDTRHARWPMPGRERGLYAAWRDLAPDDPALRRLGIGAADFAALPERPEDAVLDALLALRVPEGEWRSECRAQLLRLPGWGCHVKWRGEHPEQAAHPADLVDLLAIRLSYEARAVDAAARGILAQGISGLRALVRERLAAAPTGGRSGEHARLLEVARRLGIPADDPAALDPVADVLALLPAGDRGWVWQDAYEWHYRDALLATLSRPIPPRPAERPAAQAVFCIDARSEGLRRHLEARGPYQTYGLAGFFQLVIRHRAMSSDHESRLCPVPLTPTKLVTEHPEQGAEAAAARAVVVARDLDAGMGTFHVTKDGMLSPFTLAETAGWLAGPMSAVKTLLPAAYGRARGRLRRRSLPPATRLTCVTPLAAQAEELVAAAERQSIRVYLGDVGMSEEACEARRTAALAGHAPRLADHLGLTPQAHLERVRRAGRVGFDLDEQVIWAEFALRSLGLIEDFARLVLLTGHGSRTENNAYEAALDCGACGGQPGGTSARVACSLLNRPDVRAGLQARGIEVPQDTVFVAAEHDTATDQVTILDEGGIPPSHHADARQLSADLAAAGAALARERAARLPGRDAPGRRAKDWAQVRPEWGLARHAAFIIAPGDAVSGLDLQARTFLHSYDQRADPDATVLETILTAPGLVVQWINAQYYFSAVDPGTFGAGDKTLHNVIGDIGVLQGYGGDLRLGLPWQSVAVGTELYHEPMRILFVVEAARARVDMLVDRNDLLKRYLNGGWVSLVLREGAQAPWQRRTLDGTWEPWVPAASSPTIDHREMSI